MLYPVLQVANAITASGPTLFTLTANATPHVLGAWVEIVAALNNPGMWVEFGWHDSKANNADSATLLDIGISTGGGSEVVKIPQIGVGFAETLVGGQGLATWSLPLYFSEGQAIHARIQSLIVSHTAVVWMKVYGGGYGDSAGIGRYFNAVDTYGASVSTSKGPNVPAGTPSNTKGAWVQLSAAIPNTINGLALSVQGDSSMATRAYCIDVGRGAGGSEIPFLENFTLRINGAEEIYWLYEQPVSVLEHYIERGEGIHVRTACPTASDANVYIHVHGLRL